MRGHLMWTRVVGLAVLTLALLGAGRCEEALAKATIFDFSVGPVSTQEAGATQAGAHPDLLIHNFIANHLIEPTPCECNDPKDITVNTPPGLVGAPTDVPQCTAAEYASSTCPSDAQVGLLVVGFSFTPVYNLIARPGELALFGAMTPVVPIPTIFTSVTTRTESDYGLEFKTNGISHQLPLASEVKTITWGVPSSPVHDPVRFPVNAVKALNCFFGDSDPLPELLANQFPETDCGPFRDQNKTDEYLPIQPTPANSPAVPFLSNPTACTGPLTATIETLAYDRETDHAETPYPAMVGCDQLSFNPSLSAKPTTTQADAPSGLDIDLTVPQTLNPTTPTPSAIRDLSVSLPPGFTINPNAADGKTACTDAEANFGTRDPAQCPEYSKIGTAETISSSFPTALPGAMYLGRPLPGNRYRIFLTADGFSVHVKLAGTATLDPDSGQVTTSFKDLPQFTFQEFKLHFFGAEKGLLATPERCGIYPVLSTFTPWAYPSIPKQTSTQFFTIDSGPNGTPCPGSTRPFSPSFQAGISDNAGGAHSTFTLDLNRPDGDQNLTGLTVKTPPGFSATLKGIPYCPQAAIDQLQSSFYTGLSELASSACPAASQVGTAIAGAGAGTHPLYVPGKVYLAGPYKSAPLSLVVVIPAVSGPYDLGNVAVRAALNVDPTNAQVSAISDPLPQILEGIPLRTRFVRVSLDRKDFALNPTNCDPFSVDATVSGDEGASAQLSSYFQVANCADLAFSPKLYLKLNGPTKRNGHPAIHANLAYTANQANLKSVAVTLPRTEQLDTTHIGSACTTPQFDANQCPANSVLGTASASTPLLDNPLKGTAYLVTAGNPLPDIVLALRGQFSVNVHGIVDTAKNGGLRTTFATVPDVPVSSFRLDLQGGRKGLIVNNTDICRANLPASALIDGQNGRTADQSVGLNPPCAKARHKRHHAKHRRHKRSLHSARSAGR